MNKANIKHSVQMRSSCGTTSVGDGIGLLWPYRWHRLNIAVDSPINPNNLDGSCQEEYGRRITPKQRAKLLEYLLQKKLKLLLLHQGVVSSKY